MLSLTAITIYSAFANSMKERDIINEVTSHGYITSSTRQRHPVTSKELTSFF